MEENQEIPVEAPEVEKTEEVKPAEVEKKPLRKPVFIKLNVQKPGQNGYNVYVKITKIEKNTIKRYDGSSLQIADIVAGDETGCSHVRLKGEICQNLEVDQVIAIRNGRVMIVKSHIRLEVDRWGKVTPEDSSNVSEVKQDNDISAHEYVMKVSKYES